MGNGCQSVVRLIDSHKSSPAARFSSSTVARENNRWRHAAIPFSDSASMVPGAQHALTHSLELGMGYPRGFYLAYLRLIS
jgi:hypothetical protein